MTEKGNKCLVSGRNLDYTRWVTLALVSSLLGLIPTLQRLRPHVVLSSSQAPISRPVLWPREFTQLQEALICSYLRKLECRQCTISKSNYHFTPVPNHKSASQK